MGEISLEKLIGQNFYNINEDPFHKNNLTNENSEKVDGLVTLFKRVESRSSKMF